MSRSVDLYGTAYSNFATQALEQVRRDTYGEDFGQSSWVTADEYRRFFRLVDLGPTTMSWMLVAVPAARRCFWREKSVAASPASISMRRAFAPG